MGVAILCSGQGAQAAGMFDLVGDAPEAMPVFAAARRGLDGRDPRDLIRHASESELHVNRVSQILCCTQALAYWAVLDPALPRPITAAGYSAGELAAWGVAGVIDAGTVLDLTAQRAALMDDATHAASGVAAVLGLPRAEIEAICRDRQRAPAFSRRRRDRRCGAGISAGRTAGSGPRRHAAHSGPVAYASSSRGQRAVRRTSSPADRGDAHTPGRAVNQRH